MKKVHVAFFQNLQFLKNANFETVSDSDFIFCTMQNEGYGETSPSSDFVCTLYIQNLCLHISHISENELVCKSPKKDVEKSQKIYYNKKQGSDPYHKITTQNNT